MNLCKYLGLSYQKTLAILLALTLLALVACQRVPTPTPTPTPLPPGVVPFETIRQDEVAPYNSEQAALAVLGSPADIAKLGGAIDEGTRRFLENQDYHNATIIIVFQGWKSSGLSQYSITIQELSRASNGRILVHADFVTPESNARTEAETSPVHIIRIPSAGLDRTQFELLDKDTPIPNVNYIK